MKTLMKLVNELNTYLGTHPILKRLFSILVIAGAWLILYFIGRAVGNAVYNVMH